MEKKFKLQYNGQQLQQADVNLLGDVSGLADDRVLAELFRMTPYDGSNVAKGVLPYGHQTSGLAALVAPNGASGTVIVRPFRAFVGSRTAAGTEARDNWHDIRSGLSVAVGDVALTHSINIAAVPGNTVNPRWDLVYAQVSVDANDSSVTRKVKDPTSGVVSSNSAVPTLSTGITFGIQRGTASATPSFPSAPADGGSNYVIPLAYIYTQANMSGSTEFVVTDICLTAPVIQVSHVTGAMNMAPANQQYVLSTTEQQTKWNHTFGNCRPIKYLPPDMCGAETILISLDFAAVSSAAHSHADNAVLDSRDWRNRLCWWDVEVCPSTFYVPWWPSTSLTETDIMFDGHRSAETDDAKPNGRGQTMIQNNNASIAQTSTVMALLVDDAIAGMAAASEIYIYCDHSDGGKLKIKKSATSPEAFFFVRLTFSAPFTNVR